MKLSRVSVFLLENQIVQSWQILYNALMPNGSFYELTA
jgi:hypothetical protein